MDSAQSFLPFPAGREGPLPAAESETGGQTLRAALSRPGLALRFEPDLERAYERETGAQRGKRVFYSNVMGTVVFALLTWIDIDKLRHAADALETLRAAVLLFCGPGLLWQWIHLKQMSPRDREGLTAIGTLAMGAYVAFEANQARDVLGVMIGGHILTIILFPCLIARLRFPVAVWMTVTTLVAYAFAASTYDALSRAIVVNHLALFFGAAVISLASNYLLERKERRSYLMQRLSLLNRDAVQARAEVLRRLTLCDPLTGLANRRHFDSEIGKLWHTGSSTPGPVGLLQIDVDFFKRYNDTYGHPMGDICLQRIGERLRNVVQAHGGLAARIGGEEFAVLLPGAHLAGAEAIAQQLCEAIRALGIPHTDSSASTFVTISVGVASMQPTGASLPATLMRAADLALYRAKREGRNRCTLADPAAEPADPADAQSVAEAPASNPQQDPELLSGRASARVEQWRALLAAGQRALRFPPAVEAEYQQRKSLDRQRRLAVLVFAGMVVTCGYVWLSLPLHADVAPALMRGTLVLCTALALVWAPLLRRPMPWHWREGVFSFTTSVLLVGVLAMAAQGQSQGTPSGMLSLSLITIVSALIAPPPLRFDLPPAALLLGCVAVLTWQSAPADQALWVQALSLLSVISIYTFFGAYALDLSDRRSYLLRRLGEAQIAELQEVNAGLQRAALTDALTGLPNRRHFESHMSTLWEGCQSNDSSLALLIIDIDHFKAYNDNHGHLAGDACLQVVSAFIAQWCAQQAPLPGQRAGAFAARLGGEEFGVLLPGHGAQSALGAAERLRAGLHARRYPHAHSPVSDVLTASIGAACQRPSSSHDLRRLLRVADQALYRAKAGGRNRASV